LNNLYLNYDYVSIDGLITSDPGQDETLRMLESLNEMMRMSLRMSLRMTMSLRFCMTIRA